MIKQSAGHPRVIPKWSAAASGGVRLLEGGVLPPSEPVTLTDGVTRIGPSREHSAVTGRLESPASPRSRGDHALRPVAPYAPRGKDVYYKIVTRTAARSRS